MEVIRESFSDAVQGEEEQGGRLRGRTAENRSRCPTRTTAVEAADSLASGGRSSDEKQNNETLGTGKAKKVYKSTSTSGSGDSAASFGCSGRNGGPAKSAI